MSPRIHALRRTLLICAALFAVVLTFLALQMLRGRDPSVRIAQARTPTHSAAPKSDDGSLLSSIVGFAASALSDGDDDGHDSGGSAVRTKTS